MKNNNEDINDIAYGYMGNIILTLASIVTIVFSVVQSLKGATLLAVCSGIVAMIALIITVIELAKLSKQAYGY